MLIGIDGNEANTEKRVGSNTYAFEVLKRLPQNHQYKIFLKNSPVSDLPKNFTYELVKPSPYWTQFALPLRLFLKKDIDVFYSSSHYAPRYCPVPLIITIYDLSFEKFPRYFKKSDLVKLKNWTAYSALKANHIITISEYSKYDIIDFYKIPENKITVAYPGINREVYKVLNNKKENNGKYIVFIGTLQPRKNLENLLIALKNIKDLNLVVIGKKGWMYEEIFEKVKNLGLEKRVTFTGFIDEEKIAEILNNAQCFVLPSFYEGFGIPVVEAMACGCPVACSNTSSLPEIAGSAASLFDPQNPDDIGEKISNIINNPRYSQKLINLGLERQKLYNWDTCTKVITDSIEKCIKK